MRRARAPSGGSVWSAALVAACAVAAARGQAPVDAAAATWDLSAPDSARRLVRLFDFEEAETARFEFPRYFRRIVAEDRGFPAFGAMGLTREVAARGHWSFAFSLDGGSLSAQVPTGVVPILPMADYAVATRVRTEGLRHARARLVAWLADAAGRPIAGSRQESRPIRTNGAWETLSVRLPGDFPEATDLLVELELVQPHQLGTGEDDPHRVREQDVTGRAWFDDVTIWHLPRVDLTLAAPGNLVLQPDPAHFEVLVHDLADGPLLARLTIRDVADRVVFARDFPAPRGRHPATIEVPLARCGWYRAELAVMSESEVAARETLDLIVLPEDGGQRATGTNATEVVIPDALAEHLALLPDLVRHLGVGGVVIGVWDERTTPEEEDARSEPLRSFVEGLLSRGRRVTFALEGVPLPVARVHAVDTAQVLEMLSRDPDVWLSNLDGLLLDFGLRVRRWQLGDTHWPEAFWNDDLERLVAGVELSLGNFVPSPAIVVPFRAEQDFTSFPGVRNVNVIVPYEVRPESLFTYAQGWRRENADLTATFERLPDDVFSPRQRMLDLALRGLWGWRSGLESMAIRAPWRYSADGSAAPEPEFAVWRGLAAGLRGRRFAGELSLGDGLHAWIMEGVTDADDALVVWSDGFERSAPIQAELLLADHGVNLVDLFGNVRPLQNEEGVHRLPVSDIPVFVEHIDLPLALFRGSFAIDPSFIEATHRVHERSLVLRNPWDVGISGSIRFTETPECTITPRRREFVIGPGQELRLPLDIVIDRHIIAGVKRIEAEVQLTAPRAYRLRLHTDIRIGWKDIEVTASWTVARGATVGEPELVITAVITNRGVETVHLDTFLLAPGVRHERRVIGALPAGSTVTKTFRIPDGVARLAGKTVRLGVAERDGIAQVNQLLALPAALAEGARTERADADASK